MSFRLVDQQAVVVCQRPCEEAHEYLRRYADESLAEGSRAWDTCEKPWSINMSLKDFEKLKVELKLDNPSRTADLMQPKYPMYAYNARTELLTIRCTPSPFHESVTKIFSRALIFATDMLPASIGLRIGYTTLEIEDFRGIYRGSRQAPDFALTLSSEEGIDFIKLVVEVGFGESYEELVQEATKWLEGKPEVSVVVLLKLEETKSTGEDSMAALNAKDDKFACLDSANWTEFNASAIDLLEDFGPARFKGIEWVGKISTAYMEVWKRDATGLAARVGNRYDFFAPFENTTPILHLSHFLRIAPEDDRPVVHTPTTVCRCLNDAIKELALHRCQKVMRARKSEASSPLEDKSDSKLLEAGPSGASNPLEDRTNKKSSESSHR
ncbi:MAG: hypothetical protein MMC33_007670 [Icmadophila ericetorum]|nr:hypothetical protein [Icmadophila ericetorum]